MDSKEIIKENSDLDETHQEASKENTHEENITEENVNEESLPKEMIFEESSSDEKEMKSENFEESESPTHDQVEEDVLPLELELEEDQQMAFSGTELDSFESETIEEVEFLEETQVISILESMLFATDKPQSLNTLKQVFKGTNIKTQKIKQCLELLQIEYANAERGVELDITAGGYQLRTKIDNQDYLKRLVKGRPFKLTGPALEVLSIIAYKQPCIKFHVDEIRGVESGHLVRALMEKGLVQFGEKSELPGKPMYYQTTKKFLEIFGLRNINELPTLSEIDELIPEGIGEVEEENETLDQVTDSMGKEAIESYSESEDELMKITDKLSNISTSSEFFEQEKQREKEKREAQRAQDIREALILEEAVPDKDVKWLERYDEAQKEKLEALQEENQEEGDPEVRSVVSQEEGPESEELLAMTAVEGELKESDDLESDGLENEVQESLLAGSGETDIEAAKENSSQQLDEFVHEELESLDEASPALVEALAQFDKEEEH